ncbi:MAG: hypothetical protein FJZ79_02755 [Chlorobi bacterium]|nr:hypothetical protein [Chlorobiota bacterium]
MQQPTGHIGNVANLFDESGNLASDSLRAFAVNSILESAARVEAGTCSRCEGLSDFRNLAFEIVWR